MRISKFCCVTISLSTSLPAISNIGQLLVVDYISLFTVDLYTLLKSRLIEGSDLYVYQCILISQYH